MTERARKIALIETEERLTYIGEVSRTLIPRTAVMGQFSPMNIAVALVAFMFLGADAFVTPSAFMGVSSGPRAGATARAAGAMRSRPTMNVIDVSLKWSCGLTSAVQCVSLP